MELRDITREAIVIREDASFKDAITRMVREQTNSLLVVNENGELSGEIGVSDLLDAIVPLSMDGDSILSSLGTEKEFAEAVKNAYDILVSDYMNGQIQ